MTSHKPINSGSEAGDAHEVHGGFFVASGNSVPLLELDAEELDLVPVVVNLVRAGGVCPVALGQDRRPHTHVPDVPTEGVVGVTAIAHDPLRHPRQSVAQEDGMG